jgi:hypothetical protein
MQRAAVEAAPYPGRVHSWRQGENVGGHLRPEPRRMGCTLRADTKKPAKLRA